MQRPTESLPDRAPRPPTRRTLRERAEGEPSASEPQGRGAANLRSAGFRDEGRRRPKSAPEASGKASERAEGEPSGKVRPPYIAVIGPGAGATREEAEIARRVGGLLADRGAIVVCGGLAGIMAAACEGASARGGLTVGLLPGRDRGEGNPHLSVALPTGLGELRNGLVVGVSDAVIAIGGSWGTLSEIALAMRTGKPTVTIGGWAIAVPDAPASQLPCVALSAEQAVDEALRRASAPA